MDDVGYCTSALEVSLRRLLHVTLCGRAMFCDAGVLLSSDLLICLL